MLISTKNNFIRQQLNQTIKKDKINDLLKYFMKFPDQ